MPKATVTINITNFAPGGCCTTDRPVISPGGGGNRVRFKSNDPASPDFNTLLVKSKGKAALDIAFVLTPATNIPTGIQFQQVGGSGDPNGSLNFGTPSIAGNVITVTDVFAHEGPVTSAPHWDYTISLRNSANPPQTSTIDPGIENTDEN